MVETFPIVPLRSNLGVWIVVFLSVVPLLVGAAMATVVPAGGVLVALVSVGAAAALAYAVRGSRTARFEVSADGLRLRGDFYGRLIPAAKLRAGEARAVDLRTERELQPTLRTFGTALPGYAAGWFRLRNRGKALLYVTDRSRVAYVPTTEGYAVLLSVADPAALVASLRRVAAARA